jgi:hypothetical protein
MEIQRQLTLKSGDRTRNSFYRRCAVVGFRAGMLVHFLYNEAYNNAQRHEVEGGTLCGVGGRDDAERVCGEGEAGR